MHGAYPPRQVPRNLQGVVTILILVTMCTLSINWFIVPFVLLFAEKALGPFLMILKSILVIGGESTFGIRLVVS